MQNSDTDSELYVWFHNQNLSHSHKHKSPASSHSGFCGSSSMSNTEINTVDEEDVSETTKKRKLTPIQLRLLEESFEEEKRLQLDRKLWLAEKLGLQPSQVSVWFQNRMARFKTKQLEHNCDTLKASYAKLKADWDVLYIQNQTLKNKIALLKENLRMQESLKTQSMEAKKLGEEGSTVKKKYWENQYSFPELAVLGFYYDPTLSASNLRL